MLSQRWRNPFRRQRSAASKIRNVMPLSQSAAPGVMMPHGESVCLKRRRQTLTMPGKPLQEEILTDNIIILFSHHRATLPIVMSTYH